MPQTQLRRFIHIFILSSLLCLFWLPILTKAEQEISIIQDSSQNNPPAPRAISINPPAIYVGWVTPTTELEATVGLTVTAEISGTVCGQTYIQSLDGQLAYRIDVAAEALITPDGCGQNGRTVYFLVGDTIISDTVSWTNGSPNQFSLSQPLSTQVTGLPIVDGTSLSWQTHIAICNYKIHRSNDPFFLPSAGTQIATTTDGVYSDNSIPNLANDYYCKIEAIRCNTNSSELSQIGRFPFTFTPGS